MNGDTGQDLTQVTSRNYYHQKPRFLVQTVPVADVGPRRKAPFYFFFDHFDTGTGVLGWLLLNAVLAQVAVRNPILASLHGWLTVGVCMFLVLNSKRLIIAMSALCYASMNDTFWRMTHAGVPWETSKYLVIAMSVVILVRWIGRPQSGFCTAIMILLVPGALLGMQVLGVSTFKQTTSFVLMGMYVLAVGTMITRRLRVTWTEVKGLLWSMIGPVTAVASIAASSVAKLSLNSFNSIQSNNAAAGNFGANQVGAALGLGALFAFFIALQDNDWAIRILCFGLVTWFLAQSAITLSRGGLAAVALGIALATPHLVLHDRLGLRFLIAITAVILMAGLFLLPQLDTFSGGAVNKRFHDTNSTERGQLAAIDMELFWHHPIFGVGVGVSDQYHRTDISAFALASHTEFSRLLAEHGILGLAVIICLLGLFAEAYKRQKNWFGRAFTIGLVGWVVMDLTVASTRNAMNTFVFALAMLAIDERVDTTIPDIDTEVFGKRNEHGELELLDPELADDLDDQIGHESADATARQELADRQATSKRLRRTYRSRLHPNIGSPISFDFDDRDSPPPGET